MKNRCSKILLGLAMIVLIANTSCKKEEEKIYGCMDPSSSNYNPAANVDNGACEYNGKVTFWYNSDGTDAEVTINGQIGYITSYYPSYDPTCGSSGCANFTLPIGTYSFHAESTWSTWNGTVSITKNGCKLMLLE
jgi:hypothetical protein